MLMGRERNQIGVIKVSNLHIKPYKDPIIFFLQQIEEQTKSHYENFSIVLLLT